MEVLPRFLFLLLAFPLVALPPTYGDQKVTLDQPVPTVLRAFAPEPIEIFGFIQKGVLVFEFTVTATGDVSDVKLVSSTNSTLDDGATRTIKQWKFNPAMSRGKRVSCRATQTLNFK